MVSATNGDIWHWQSAGGPLAQRRKNEVIDVARRLGVTTEVVDIHDGEIMPTLENRRIITTLIRQWNAYGGAVLFETLGWEDATLRRQRLFRPYVFVTHAAHRSASK